MIPLLRTTAPPQKISVLPPGSFMEVAGNKDKNNILHNSDLMVQNLNT